MRAVRSRFTWGGIVLVTLLAVLAGCKNAADSHVPKAVSSEASQALSAAFDAYEGTPPTGITISTNIWGSKAGTDSIDFSNFPIDGMTINGMLDIKQTVATSTTTLAITGDLTIDGAGVQDLGFDITMTFNDSYSSFRFTGTVTADGTSYDVNELDLSITPP